MTDRGWRLGAGLGGLAMLPLLVPLASVRTGGAFDWTASDFGLAALLLGGTGLGAGLALRRLPGLRPRAGAPLAMLTGLLLVWTNGAVGLIGSEANPANLAYVGVPAVALLGSALARFRPGGMARALAAAAVLQALIPVAAAALGLVPAGAGLQVAGLTAAFAALWLLAARLLRRAG